MRHDGAGIRSLAEPVVDSTSDFAELVLAMLGVAAKLERRRIMERTAVDAPTPRQRASCSDASPYSHPINSVRRANGSTQARQRSVARSYNVSQATISRLGV
jgi:hypothetical protein